MVYDFFSGSYGEVGEDGIVKFRLDTDAATLTKVFSYQKIRNPSYIQLNSDRTMLYAVQEETPVGTVHALRVSGDAIMPVGKMSTEGADPCFICLTKNKKLMIVTNYTSGSLAVYRLGADGSITGCSELVAHKGKGTHPIRQESPHVHYVMEHNGQAFAADLGLDLVYVYSIDYGAGKLVDSGVRLSLPAGAGPRHIASDPERPKVIYVIFELSNQIGVYLDEGMRYTLVQMVPTLPDSFKGENTAAAIKIRNSLLFASNRGHDSIAVYRIKENGLLEPTQIIASVGNGPRDFELLGEHMVIANQYSNSINVLKVNWDTGTLEDTGISCSTPRPCCIQS